MNVPLNVRSTFDGTYSSSWNSKFKFMHTSCRLEANDKDTDNIKDRTTTTTKSKRRRRRKRRRRTTTTTKMIEEARQSQEVESEEVKVKEGKEEGEKE